MVHLIKQMAYVGATPWHGLGNQLTPKQLLEVWQREANMYWQILETQMHFKSEAIRVRSSYRATSAPGCFSCVYASAKHKHGVFMRMQ